MEDSKFDYKVYKFDFINARIGKAKINSVFVKAEDLSYLRKICNKYDIGYILKCTRHKSYAPKELIASIRPSMDIKIPARKFIEVSSIPFTTYLVDKSLANYICFDVIAETEKNFIIQIADGYDYKFENNTLIVY